MIDSHCHIDLQVFEQSRSDIIESCRELGIQKLLVPGLGLEQFQGLMSLQQQYNMLDIAIGLHPYFLPDISDSEFEIQLDDLCKLAIKHKSKIIAVGECGLDFSLCAKQAKKEDNITEQPPSFRYSVKRQYSALETQIDLAAELKKPLILHHRRSHNELIKLLKQKQFSHGGVIHAFSGSYQTALIYLDMGFYLGVGGTITYDRAKKTRASIEQIPLCSLLLETDSPDMPLSGFQGEVNTPTQLPLVAKALSELKNIDVTQVIEETTGNYYRLFHS